MALYTNFDRSLWALHAIATQLNRHEMRVRRLWNKVQAKRKWIREAIDCTAFEELTFSAVFELFSCIKIEFIESNKCLELFTVHTLLLCWRFYAQLVYIAAGSFFRRIAKLNGEDRKRLRKQFLSFEWNSSICALFYSVRFHVYWLLLGAVKDERQSNSPISQSLSFFHH